MAKNRQGLSIRQTEQCRVIRINMKGRTEKSTARNNEQRKQHTNADWDWKLIRVNWKLVT